MPHALLLALACGEAEPPTTDSEPPVEDTDEDTGDTGEPCEERSFWMDADGDGYGDPEQEVQACEAPEGAVEEGGDCDDADPAVNPGAVEVCNGVNDDCSEDGGEAGSYAWSGSELELEGEVVLAEDGVLELCEGTWSLNLVVEAEVQILARGEVAVDGGEAPVVRVGSSGKLRVEGVDLVGGQATQSVFEDTLGGGGVFCEGGEVELVDLRLEGNAGEAGAGLGLIEGCEARLEGVTVAGNEAASGAGAWVGADSSLVCSSSSFVDSESGAEAGVVMAEQEGALFTAEACDFGTEEGGDANSGDDLYWQGRAHDAQDEESFVCDDRGCLRASQSVEVGSDAIKARFGSGYGGANLVQADADALVEGFGLTMAGDGTCSTANMGVFVADSTDGPWTLAWFEEVSVDTTSKVVSASEIALNVEAGRWYLFGAAGPDCDSLTLRYDSGFDGAEVGFGQLGGHASGASFYEGWAPWVGLGTGTAYHMELTSSQWL